MKVLVCGGRTFDNADWLNRSLDRVHQHRAITLLIHGGARGADALTAKWAANNDIQQEVHQANWDLHGKAAGPIRNHEMLKSKPDIVIAFPGGKGTRDMVDQARGQRVPVYEAGQPRPPLNFEAEPERRDWIINHADYFTTYLRTRRHILRDQWPTLAKAERAAQRILVSHPDRVVMIYAVAGVHDTWVKNVKRA